MDAQELDFARVRYSAFLHAARRRRRLVALRNYTAGFLAFCGFWTAAAAPLALLPLLPAQVVGALALPWILGLAWLLRTHPALRAIALRWTAEHLALRADESAYARAVQSFAEEQRRRA